MPDEQRVCPKCGGFDFTRLGDGKMTEEYELVPAMVERRLLCRRKRRCRCGETILAAPAPTKVFDKARFGPTFMAQVAVSKCADSLPVYRQGRRTGAPAARQRASPLLNLSQRICSPVRGG